MQLNTQHPVVERKYIMDEVSFFYACSKMLMVKISSIVLLCTLGVTPFP
jgi:hypothetical protein